MAFTLGGTSPNAWISQTAGTTDDDASLATFINTNSAALNGSTVISYTGPDGGIRRVFNINVVGQGNGTDLIDSTGGVLYIQGTFNHNARLNNYIYGVSQFNTGTTANTCTATWVIPNGGTLNMTGTVQGTNRSLGSSSHLASFRGSFFSGINAFVKANAGGTFNTNGVGFYANQTMVFAGRRNNVSTNITRWTDNGSTIRLGSDATGTNMLIRSDIGDGAPTFPSVLYNNRYNLTGTTFVDSTLSCAGAYDNINSSFSGLQFLRESTVPAGQRGATLTAIQLYAPQNLVGIDYGTYDTHFASVYNLETVAYRTTQYGFRTGLAPRIGKNGDRQVANNWFELRKQLNLTFRNASNQLASNVYTYFEDSLPAFAGQLAQVNTQGFGAYATFNGNFTSNAIAGGTGGRIIATFVSGAFQGCSIDPANPGTGYSADITNYQVSAANFPGLASGGTVTSAAVVTIYPAIRRAAGTAGQPSWTANNTYSGTSNAAGLLSAVNPARPSGTNSGGTALTGVDVLLGGTNYTLTGLSNGPACQGLNQIDYRMNTGTYLAPSYNITLPLRGYLYDDATYTATMDGLAQNLDDTIIQVTDTYAAGSGLTEAQANGIGTAVTLVAPAPSRGALASGDTTGRLIQSITGTLTAVGPATLTSSQLYAKAKRDYVQPVLNANAGTVARTGFGMASFMTGTGVANAGANLALGTWVLDSSAPITTGVFSSISTTGNVFLRYANSGPLAHVAVSGANVNYDANSTILGSVTAIGTTGTPASWRTNSNLGAGTGSYSFTATLPAGLAASSVTAAGVSITGTAATDIPVIQNAMDAALDAAGVSDISIAIEMGTGTFATITYGGTYTLFNSSYGSSATFNVPNAAGTGTVACAITASGSWATQAAGMGNIVTALNNNANFTNAGWRATTNGTTVTMTRTTTGVLATTTATITGQDANWLFNMPSASWTLTFANGTVGGNILRATFIAATPAVGNVIPTSALTFLTSPATYITGTTIGGADRLQSSVGATAGTITYPTTGTIINTSGTITGQSGTITATGPITVQGGFRQGSYTGTGTNPLNVALTTSGSFTLRGANTLDSGLTISGGSSGLITLGETTDTAASRTTYGANTSRQHDVELTGSTAGGTVTVNSGLLAGGTTQTGLTVVGYNVNLGSGLDSTGAAKLSVAGQTTATGNIVTINGMRTATANLSTIAFQAEARTAGNLGGVITATDLNIGGTGVKNFLLNPATNPGTMTFTRCDFGGSPTFITLRNSGGSIALNNCTTTAVIRNGDTSGTIGVAGGSTLTGGIDSLNLTTLLVTGGSTVGLLALPAINNVTLGNAAGTAILTNGGSALNAAKNTVYAIDNLDLTGNLTIAQAPAAAFTMTPTINMRTGSTLTIDCGSSNNLTIDASKVTFANAGTTFARAAGATGTIKLLNWPNGKAIPAPGFSANITTKISLVLNNAPVTAPALKVAEVYKNGNTTNILAGLTPTYANGTFTWPDITSSADDVFNGGVFFVDGYQVTRASTLVNTTLTATAVKEDNVDFGQALATRDTAFISTTSWSSANAFFAVAPYVSMTTSTTVDYTTTPTTRTAVELGKLVMRRTMETSDAGTVEMRRAMAFGTLAVDFFRFTATGMSLTQIAGLATTGVGLKINKVANVASQNAVVTWAIWAVDNLGDFYNLNSANGRNPTTPTTLILWEGFSPGAVANLTTGQINQIGSGVSSVLTATGGPLRVLADGVQDASLVIPTTITFS